MEKKYQFKVEVLFDAADDVEAREMTDALQSLSRTCSIKHFGNVDVSLREILPNNPPRKVQL